MAKIRDVLKHVSVEVASRKRKCHRDSKHTISGGTSCLVIKEGMMAGSKNYCSTCAVEILTVAEAKLLQLGRGIA